MASLKLFQRGDVVLHSSTKTFRVDRVLKHRLTGKMLLIDEEGNAFFSEECMQIISVTVDNFVFHFPRYLFFQSREWTSNLQKNWLGYIYECSYGLKGVCVDMAQIYSTDEDNEFTASYLDLCLLNQVCLSSDNEQN